MTYKTTIWSELETWAQGFKPWQRFVLANAIRSRRLTDDQIEQAYRLFLHDYDLEDAPDPPIQVPSAITGRPVSDAPSPIRLKRIEGLRAINALPAGAELTFSPTLTVVYGGNGVGKSGFTRILTNVCFSRKSHPILPNVYEDEANEEPAATIVVTDAENNDTPLAFDGSSQYTELKRIAVFDTDTSRAHLRERNPLGFTPAGFDVFPEMARVYGEISNRLTNELESRNRENAFTKSFVAPESSVSQFVGTLSADTDVSVLRRLAAFGDAEAARFDEINRQITRLQSKSAAEVIGQLKESKHDLGKLRERLTSSRSLLTEKKRAKYRAQLAELAAKVEQARKHGSESFKQEFFSSIGTAEWEEFLTGAHALAQIEHKNYPQEDDHCLLCHRPLDEASVALIRRFWEFLAHKARQEAEEAKTQLAQAAQSLKSLRLDFFSADTAVRAQLAKLNPALTARIDALVSKMESDRQVMSAVLESATGDIGPEAFDEVDSSLAALIEQVDSDTRRLEKENVEDALKALQAERITLRHRQVLKQLLPEIEKYVTDLMWVKNGSGEPQRSLNTRALTDKEKDFFQRVIAQEYKERFADERKALKCDLPIELHTRGQRGKTVRSLVMKGGHSPDRILSEGEQRAVALADFLTEIALNPANAGIVLDDPVTSQDHERKKLIARRLAFEAKNRQVAIFTHDLVFLTMLASAAGNEQIEMLTHWIERDSEDRPGQISLDDCPATTPQYRNTEKARRTLAEAKSVAGSKRMKLLQRGMGELRRTVEEIVPHFLLKQVVNRWTDRVIVTGLNRVNWDEGLVDDIVTAYEDLSAFIEGHSHTEEWAATPLEPRHLEEKIKHVNGLIKQARPARTKPRTTAQTPPTTPKNPRRKKLVRYAG